MKYLENGFCNAETLQYPALGEDFGFFYNTVSTLCAKVRSQDPAALTELNVDGKTICLDVISSIISFPQLMEITDDDIGLLEKETGIKLG